MSLILNNEEFKVEDKMISLIDNNNEDITFLERVVGNFVEGDKTYPIYQQTYSATKYVVGGGGLSNPETMSFAVTKSLGVYNTPYKYCWLKWGIVELKCYHAPNNIDSSEFHTVYYQIPYLSNVGKNFPNGATNPLEIDYINAYYDKDYIVNTTKGAIHTGAFIVNIYTSTIEGITALEGSTPMNALVTLQYVKNE